MSNAAKSWLNPQEKSSKRAMSSTSLFSVDCVSSKTWSKKYKNKSEVFCLSNYRSSPPRNAQSFLNCPRKNFSTCFAEAYTLNAMRLNPLTHVVHLPTTSPFPTHLSWSALQQGQTNQASVFAQQPLRDMIYWNIIEWSNDIQWMPFCMLTSWETHLLATWMLSMLTKPEDSP